jgi:hypothetical protein
MKVATAVRYQFSLPETKGLIAPMRMTIPTLINASEELNDHAKQVTFTSVRNERGCDSRLVSPSTVTALPRGA